MGFYGLVLGSLCVWRITHFLSAEDGPWDIGVRMRRAAGAGVLGRLLDCFYCLSVWTAAPIAVAVGRTLAEQILLWPGLSAGAILLERVTAPTAAGPAHYTEGALDEDREA